MPLTEVNSVVNMRARDAAAHFFHPLTPEEFISECFEKKPHVFRRSADHYRDWVDPESLMTLLTTLEPSVLGLKAVKGTSTLPRISSLAQAMEAFRQGATLLANGLQLVHSQVAVLCRKLEGFLHQPIQSNMYLTPAGNKGFAAHFDTHDVFIVQLSGSKRWFVYNPALELPYPEDLYKLQLLPGVTPLIEVTLEPGDMLYMPRGYVHAGEANLDTSLHLSVGVTHLTWRDALRAQISLLADEHPLLRRSVKVGMALGGPGAQEELEQVLELLGQQLREELLPMAEETFVLGRPMLLPSQRLLGPPDCPLTPSSPVGRNMLMPGMLKCKGGRLELIAPGKRVSLPMATGFALKFIFERTDPFMPGDLPGLEEGDQIGLVQCLLDEGLLLRLP